MMLKTLGLALAAGLLATSSSFAQDTTGAIEGDVTDKTASAIVGARIVATNLETGFSKETTTNADGFYRLLQLPVGRYSVAISDPRFAALVRQPIQVNVSQTSRVNAKLELRSLAESVTVTGDAQLVETSTNALGRIVTGSELVDLPLNGRNFTQLGLLQTGVAPLTAGVATAGGSLRQGQSVRGQRHAARTEHVPGRRRAERQPDGWRLRAQASRRGDRRISDPDPERAAEYGGTGGATTSVVTRSGANQFHGNLYEFLRNDVFDARNFFSADVEPLKQNQFGGTIGGPITRDKLLFFGYYEGFRNRQGTTTTATVPTAQERQGDFSGMSTPLLNFAAGGVPFPGNQIPQAAINPVSRNVVSLYPLGNVSPSIYRATLVGENDLDQAGGRIDYNLSNSSQIFGRYSYSGGHNINPISVRGTDVPGFPTRDDISTHAATLSSTHILSPSLTNLARGTYLEYEFFFDQRLNRTPPSALGFGYDSSNEVGQGPPFFNVSGYTPIGGAITGPRNTTQYTFEIQDALTWTRGGHLVKVGGEFRRTGIDMIQAIAPNAFFVFASTFPTNNAMANLLLGAPVTFYQGLGDFRRRIDVTGLGLYAQDEWRLGSRMTFNYGLRYERINPFTETEDRLNAFVPGVRSTVRPDAPVGLLFPGDPGIARGIAESANAFMPRVGAVWDPAGNGIWSVRASYGLFYDQFQNGSGTASQVAISATPWAQFNQFSGAGLNFQNPYQGRTLPAPNTFVRPSTVFALDPEARPPAVQNWNVGIQRSIAEKYLVEVRYVGATGKNLPATSKPIPPSMGLAPLRRTPTGDESTPTVPPTAVPAISRPSRCCETSRTRRITPARPSSRGALAERSASTCRIGYSRTFDYLSSMNLSGAAAKPLAGENDIAQNPFDLDAEYGPSLFDARHRFVASASWKPTIPDGTPAAVRVIFGGWQLNGIATHNSGTPFTVSDSANVALQANSPPISGFPASRPDLVGDPNAGPRTVDEWLSRSAFRRLNLQTEAGQFGNAGRNIARGPSYTNVDMSLVRDFQLPREARLQFRAEVFNVANHPNFGLPVADLNSANFGRIFSAAAPRLLQFGLKLIF